MEEPANAAGGENSVFGAGGELRLDVERAAVQLAAHRATVAKLVQEAHRRDAELQDVAEQAADIESRHVLARRTALELAGAEEAKLRHDARLLAAVVDQLRAQKERHIEVLNENASMSAEVVSLCAQRDALGFAHAAAMHTTSSEHFALWQQLEQSFRKALRDKAQRHHEQAYDSLPLPAKEALLRNAQLREELALQKTGLDAVDRRCNTERAEVHRRTAHAARLKAEQSDRGVLAAETRRARDAARARAERLRSALVALTEAQSDHVANTIAALDAAHAPDDWQSASNAGRTGVLSYDSNLESRHAQPGVLSDGSNSESRRESQSSRSTKEPSKEDGAAVQRRIEGRISAVLEAVSHREADLAVVLEKADVWARRAQELQSVSAELRRSDRRSDGDGSAGSAWDDARPWEGLSPTSTRGALSPTTIRDDATGAVSRSADLASPLSSTSSRRKAVESAQGIGSVVAAWLAEEDDEASFDQTASTRRMDRGLAVSQSAPGLGSRKASRRKKESYDGHARHARSAPSLPPVLQAMMAQIDVDAPRRRRASASKADDARASGLAVPQSDALPRRSRPPALPVGTHASLEHLQLRALKSLSKASPSPLLRTVDKDLRRKRTSLGPSFYSGTSLGTHNAHAASAPSLPRR
ncbi:hypothetical protein M885DRAFT_616749 [Pelagophyceae sp. CCMP2097]|nr:hypothetical protein M885DRAFT_616749 [Pelagophyceae sp. CCMP2097]